MFTRCESAQISIKANKNIELTIPFVQLPNHVCFQTTNYDANINTVYKPLSSFHKFTVFPHLFISIKSFPQHLYGTMVI